MINQITIQDVAITATNQYALTDSTTTSTDGTMIEIDLSLNNTVSENISQEDLTDIF